MKSSPVEEEVRSSGAVGRVSIITFVSRVLGLVREQVKAFFLGTGVAADAFTVGFMIPNLLRRFLAEGVMSAAVIPVFTEYLGGSEEKDARRFVSILLGTLLVVLAVVVGAGMLLAPSYVPFFFGRFGPEKAALTTFLTIIMFPYIGFVSLAALFQGILNCHGRFSLPALCPVALNVIVIGAGYALAPRGGDAASQAEAARILALTVLVGGVAQALLLVPDLLRLGYRLRPRVSFVHAGLRRVGRLLAPVALGAGIYQINAVVSLVIAAQVGFDGAVSGLSYSVRLLELALGVFVLSIITVALPGLARLWNGENRDRFFAQAAYAMKLVLLVSVPAGFGLLFLRREIITVLLSFGAFDRESIDLTEFALLFHAASVPLTGACRCFAQSFYAARDGRTPFWIGLAMAATNVLFCLALVGPLYHGGIAFAMTLSGAIGTALYGYAWRRKHGARTLGDTAPFAVRVAAAGLLMGVFHAGWNEFIYPFPEGAGHAIMIAHLALALCADTAVFFAAARVLGVKELGDLFRTLIGRRFGRRAEAKPESESTPAA